MLVCTSLIHIGHAQHNKLLGVLGLLRSPLSFLALMLVDQAGELMLLLLLRQFFINTLGIVALMRHITICLSLKLYVPPFFNWVLWPTIVLLEFLLIILPVNRFLTECILAPPPCGKKLNSFLICCFSLALHQKPIIFLGASTLWQIFYHDIVLLAYAFHQTYLLIFSSGCRILLLLIILLMILPQSYHILTLSILLAKVPPLMHLAKRIGTLLFHGVSPLQLYSIAWCLFFFPCPLHLHVLSLLPLGCLNGGFLAYLNYHMLVTAYLPLHNCLCKNPLGIT